MYLGIDLGGTKIAAAVVNESGEILGYYRMPTGDGGVEAVTGRMAQAARQALQNAGFAPEEVTGLGVGFPGAVSWREGVVSHPPNLSGWGKVPLAKILADDLKMRVFVENDANAAALGEWLYGAGRGCQDMLYLTVSTGIGGGLIAGGRLLHGRQGTAGEVGHMVLDPLGPECGCGNRGCWEALSSGTAIARAAAERIRAGEESLLARDSGKITAELVFKAYSAGDRLAREVVDRAMDFLGLGIANLVNVLNPQRVVIGGGVARVGETLFRPVREKVHGLAFGPAAAVEIVPAALESRAGVIGAAAVCRLRMELGGKNDAQF